MNVMCFSILKKSNKLIQDDNCHNKVKNNYLKTKTTLKMPEYFTKTKIKRSMLLSPLLFYIESSI